jgi:hypothetical protein
LLACWLLIIVGLIGFVGIIGCIGLDAHIGGNGLITDVIVVSISLVVVSLGNVPTEFEIKTKCPNVTRL